MFDKIFDIGLKSAISYYPQEFVTLKEALDGKDYVTVNGGFKHVFKKDELDKLSKNLPLYLWDLVKIPFVIVKTLNVGEYILNGSEWENKAISILLKKDIKSFMTIGDVEKIIKDYKSLVFITLSPLGNLTGGDEDNGYY
ncbi:DUF61 family protein [Stygiolobus caldivivus]|uniref:DUF61 family protein n=1 Tax=Stygiolobus caldivivus TaxID=2824673 RepID=A0A8D5U913_9CREN|nr:DUF61 family protein [Stygiolobus caldivivus]BCU71167.1 hypothetical protein KN1_24640 [Stygiolobus caldivivus]